MPQEGGSLSSSEAPYVFPRLREVALGPVYICACVYSLCPSSLGSMIERILVSCTNQQDLHEWVEHLQKQTKVTSVSNPTIKPHSVPSHTVRQRDRNGLCWGGQWMQEFQTLASCSWSCHHRASCPGTLSSLRLSDP